MEAESERWGTWEKLILGGAVLRHGTKDWGVVCSELRTRTLYPCIFTPEVCKAKYEDLLQRYYGCTAWFEELRKQRVAELKQELEKSEDSIGSLESKLENLKANKPDYNQVDYYSSQTEPSVPLPKSERLESSGKETSKDGLSAGSFTQDTRANWSPEFQIPATSSAAEMERKPEILPSYEEEKLLSNRKPGLIGIERGTIRKRRGKRKRKECNMEPKEGSIGESKNLGSTSVATTSQCRENSVSDCGQTVRSSCVNYQSRPSSGARNDDLMSIFNSVAENENALVFRHRLDGQKRGRYKKIVRRHMDFDTIRSRIANCSILSAKELFRDILLLANNAVVFYSKRTREYKSARSLRDFVTKEYRQVCKDSDNKPTSALLSISSIYYCPVKPRSFRPFKSKFLAKAHSVEGDVSGTLESCKKQSNADSSPSVESSILPKEGFSVGCGIANQRTKTLMKERKKARQR